MISRASTSTTEAGSSSVTVGTQTFFKNISLAKSNLKQSKKIKAIAESNRRLKKKVSNYFDLMKHLRQKYACIENNEFDVLESLGNTSNTLKQFFDLVSKTSVNLPVQKSVSPDIKAFALTLHYYSPRAYEYVRNTFCKALPHKRTITKWYSKVNAEPGFTKESLEFLKHLASKSNNTILVSLSMDEMYIRKQITYDPSKEKDIGYVDYGCDIDDDSSDLASQAIVFMVTGINRAWKMPVGYFLVNSLTESRKRTLLDIGLQLLFETGVQVVSLTFDGESSNIAMAKSLGCSTNLNDLRPYFFFEQYKISILYDPPHMLKLIRNTLGDYKVFIDGDGNKIKFSFFEKLLVLQEEKGLHLGNKIKMSHICFQKSKMKVRLATELFSNSVADAIEFCEKSLKLPNFCNSGPTVKFIKMINNIFDILNSTSLFSPGWKKSICMANFFQTREYFLEFKEYVSKLQFEDGTLILESRRHLGLRGFLVSLQSCLNIFEDLAINSHHLKFLSTYRLCQDHLEMFFGIIRSKGGFNDNPNVVQFKSAYKKILVRTELKAIETGNCVSLEQISILTQPSTNPNKIITETTYNFEQMEQSHDDDDDDSFDEALNFGLPLEEYAQYIVAYIAGFIVRKLMKKNSCATCHELLLGEKTNIFNSLIKKKDRGGLIYPSAGVVKVVENAEKIIRDGRRQNATQIITMLWEKTNYYSLFSSANSDHDSKHVYLLIKSIVELYIRIRYHYEAKKKTNSNSIRNYMKKIILFRNE